MDDAGDCRKSVLFEHLHPIIRKFVTSARPAGKLRPAQPVVPCAACGAQYRDRGGQRLRGVVAKRAAMGGVGGGVLVAFVYWVCYLRQP